MNICKSIFFVAQFALMLAPVQTSADEPKKGQKTSTLENKEVLIGDIKSNTAFAKSDRDGILIAEPPSDPTPNPIEEGIMAPKEPLSTPVKNRPTPSLFARIKRWFQKG